MERVNRRVFDFTRFILYSSHRSKGTRLVNACRRALSLQGEGKKEEGGSHFVEELTQQDWPSPPSSTLEANSQISP